MIANQESESSTYPLKNVNFVGGFTKKNFGKAQNFFIPPTRFREEARDFLRLWNLMPTVKIYPSKKDTFLCLVQ